MTYQAIYKNRQQDFSLYYVLEEGVFLFSPIFSTKKLTEIHIFPAYLLLLLLLFNMILLSITFFLHVLLQV